MIVVRGEVVPGRNAPDQGAVFLHNNKGRPAGRKSAHTEMVSIETVVPTITTDGHAQSAVAYPVLPGVHEIEGEMARHLVFIDGDSDDELDLRPLAFTSKDSGGDVGVIAPTLRAGPYVTSHANSGVHIAVCIALTQDLIEAAVRRIGYFVRRLLPSECLRLQGFPPDHLDRVEVAGKPLADGPRLKMTGNSWCVDVVGWVFGRIDEQLREQFVADEQSNRNAK